MAKASNLDRLIALALAAGGVHLLLLALTGCGGGGGGGGASGGGSATGSTELGKRDLPGYSLRVQQPTASAPGAYCALDILLEGDVPPSAVAIGLAVGDAAPTYHPAVAAGAGRWRAELPVPTGGLPVYARIRVDGADGGVLETGRVDFRLR